MACRKKELERLDEEEKKKRRKQEEMEQEKQRRLEEVERLRQERKRREEEEAEKKVRGHNITIVEPVCRPCGDGSINDIHVTKIDNVKSLQL